MIVRYTYDKKLYVSEVRDVCSDPAANTFRFITQSGIIFKAQGGAGCNVSALIGDIFVDSRLSLPPDYVVSIEGTIGADGTAKQG